MEKGSDKVLVVRKPKGLTSHDVVERVRKIYGTRKVGHAGTLDPLATGVLVVLLGKATKRQAEFMALEKEYEAEVTFGVETDTYDGEGKIVISYPLSVISKITEDVVRKALRSFVGEIEQTVPPYSAVKVGGKKLYRLARGGALDMTKLPRREVSIKEIELLDFKPPKLTGDRLLKFEKANNLVFYLPRARLRIVCSKGTYIRSLAHDLGKKLGCGAYLSDLVRTRVGPYRLDGAVSLGTIRH